MPVTVSIVKVLEEVRTDNAVFSELILDDRVVGDGDSLTVDLCVPAPVDEHADSLEIRLAIGDVGIDKVEHLLGRLGDPDKHAVVDLEKAEELQYLLRLRRNLRDTAASAEKA